MKHIWIAGCFVFLVAGLATGYWFGQLYSVGQYDMQKEFQVHYNNLGRKDIAPQTREYLKSRIYFLSCFIDPHHLQGYNFDFGPVNEAVLGPMSGIKGPESQADVYACAVEKLRKARTS